MLRIMHNPAHRSEDGGVAVCANKKDEDEYEACSQGEILYAIPLLWSSVAILLALLEIAAP